MAEDQPGRLRRAFKRVRPLVSLLSDVGGAAFAISAGLGLLVVVAGGGLLLAHDLLPPALFVLFCLGSFLLTFGVAVYLLGPRLRTAESSALQSGAATTQKASRRSKRDARRAVRRVRGELLDNRRILGRMHRDQRLGPDALGHEAWDAEEKHLIELVDARPHRAASDAYRSILVIERARSSRSFQVVWSEVLETIEEIDAAVGTLNKVDK